jgi:hypothetical protein
LLLHIQEKQRIILKAATMKSSLAHPQHLRRILCQAAKQRHLAEIRCVGIRGFASARTLPDEAHQGKIAAAMPMRGMPSSLGPKTAPTAIVYDYQGPSNAQVESPSEIQYAGNVTMPLTTVLHIVKPSEDTPRGIWPVFRLMDENGRFRDPAFDAARKDMQEIPAFAPFGPTHQLQAQDLSELRTKLQQQYPFHAKELERCTLLQESKHPYQDTDSKHTLLRAYRQIVRLREMDTIFQVCPEGISLRISFFQSSCLTI